MTFARIRLRRGTAAQVAAVTDGLDGEPFYTLDTEKLFIADETGVPKKLSPDDLVGATSGSAGTAGLVPAPAAGDQVKFLRGDATWQPAGGTRSSIVHTSASLASGATEQSSFTAPKTFTVGSFSADHPCRFRLYLNSTDQAADLARAVGVDPDDAAPCLLDVTLPYSGLLSLNSKWPPIIKLPTGTTCYISTTNNDSVSRAIAVTVDVLSMEG